MHHKNIKNRSARFKLNPICLSCWSAWGWLSCICLALVTLLLLSPTVTESSSALSPAELQTNMPTSGSIALALPGEATLDVVPTSSGSFSSATAKLSVSSTNPTGYSLYINTNDNTNALANVDSTKTATIPAVSGAQLGSQLDANTWGYNLSPTSSDALSLNYQAVPLKSSTPVLSTKASSSDSYYLTFGTKLDTSLPAGQYANTITISAIANPLYITGLLNLTYMQDMTSSVCANTVAYDGTNIKGQPGSEVTKQLIDSRDGKEYWVAKLADGNCWMTQNLALDLNSSKALTSSDTDLNSKERWVPDFDTITKVEAPVKIIEATYDETKSWNLGQYVLAVPSRGVLCNSAPANGSTSNDGANAVRPGQTLAQNCPDFVDVGTSDWSPTFKIQNGTWQTTEDRFTPSGSTSSRLVSQANGTPKTYFGPVAVNQANKTYDAHYLIGNYYQWNTTTAGSGAGLMSPESAKTDSATLVNATDSICPKGWQLPVSGSNGINGLVYDLKDSFYQLLLAYDYPANTQYTVDQTFKIAHTPILQGAFDGASGTASQNYYSAPLHYVNAGNIVINLGALRNVGTYGDLWSSTAYYESDYEPSIKNAFYNSFSYYSVAPAYALYRHQGYSVRCLAR